MRQFFYNRRAGRKYFSTVTFGHLPKLRELFNDGCKINVLANDRTLSSDMEHKGWTVALSNSTLSKFMVSCSIYAKCHHISSKWTLKYWTLCLPCVNKFRDATNHSHKTVHIRHFITFGLILSHLLLVAEAAVQCLRLFPETGAHWVENAGSHSHSRS